MTSAANKIKQFKALRENSIERMQDLQIIAESAKGSKDFVAQFKVRYSHLEIIHSDFEKNHSSLLSLAATTDDYDFALEKTIRKEFDETYFKIKEIYVGLFDDVASTSSQNISKASNVRLPKIELVKFDGTSKNWRTFLDTFESLVHDNDSLSNIEKFTYLISSLTGAPLNLVKCSRLSDANYQIAFDALKTRYENKRALATAHYFELEKAPKITEGNSNPLNLRNLLDIYEENLAALKNMGFPTSEWDFLIFNMLLNRLDSDTVAKFETENSSDEIPKFEDLTEFLRKQCNALDRTLEFCPSKRPHKYDNSKNKIVSNKPHFSLQQRPSSTFFTHTKPSQNCSLCKKDHLIYKCPDFLSLSPQERYNTVKSNKWCINCLGFKHMRKDCTSHSTCFTCKQNHHTLLHFDKVTSNNNADGSSNHPHPQGSALSLTNLVPTKTSVLLSTALVEARDSRNNFQVVRALFDSGSQASFITEKCCNKLGIPRTNISLSIQGLGHMNSNASKCVSLTLKPCHYSTPTFQIDAIVLPQICENMPKTRINRKSWSHISNLKLADPSFDIPNPIDILLGADLFPHILSSGHLNGNADEPVAINTVFGWILMGIVKCPLTSVPLNSFFCSCDISLERSLKRFWELENIPTKISLNPDDVICEDIYQKNVSRSVSGRFTVALPFRVQDPSFPESKSIAHRRFMSLERRLLRDTSLQQQYCEFLQNYLDSGHMSLSHSEEFNPHQSYYIPHHSVINLNSTTTKLRVVFDASCKASNGVSLNDTLFTGPKLQNDLFTILLNFRKNKVALTSDIRHMFNQINIRESDRKYQKILWRFSPEHPLQEFCLNSVVFGICSSPYLAIKTLNQLSEEDGSRFPLAAEAIRSSSYVDDFVISVDSFENAQILKTQLIHLLRKGGFELHKWASNYPSLVEDTTSDSPPLSLDFENKTNKVLGLKWDSSRDFFSFDVTPIESPCTKRSILSELARIYDPLGFLAPLTLLAKGLIQHLWTLALEWDMIAPPQIISKWNQYKAELPFLCQIAIPRYIFNTTLSACELHGFADASEKGYAAVIYMRTQTDNAVNITLVCAKSKVSPLKSISIPRLELCAAVLLSELLQSVLPSYQDHVHFNRVVAWTDSTITLAWIKSPPYKFKVFVSNRISRIQEILPPSIWNYVPSNDNPADCASRGLFPSALLDHPLWWAGPPWLKDPPSSWPTLPNSLPHISVEEKVQSFTATISHTFFDNLLENISSLPKVQRIIAFVRRFIFNCSHPSVKTSNHLTSTELENALLDLIKYVQQQAFADEISRLENNKPLSKCFKTLNPFLDPQGILRVGGRLSQSKFSYDKRFPIFLPSKHIFTTLLIETIHKRYLHPGVQSLHFLLSQKFWILSSKKVIRKVTSKCHNCWKLKPVPFQPPMGNLPPLRISQIKPFSCVGVDFAGPLSITLGKTRGAKTLKAYICVFICFTTKALHLELVSDLSTDAFLAALRRFVARRGRCSYIFSDCGTNFVGASKKLVELMKGAAHEETLDWHFNPPSAPHFGGLWEAGVKSVKTHLFRVIGEQILTYEELNTLLIQIEAILNSRPLCPVSTDPNDLSVLTPGHFLTLEPLNSPPESDFRNLKLNRLSRWELTQRLHQDFWARWSREYLHTLHQRSKWLDSSAQAAPGTVVLIKVENLPPLRWEIGRVVEIHPGADGVARVATVRTSHGTFKRPLVKLCPLPMDPPNP